MDEPTRRRNLSKLPQGGRGLGALLFDAAQTQLRREGLAESSVLVDFTGLINHRVSNTCKSGTFGNLFFNYKWTVLEDYWKLEARIETTGPGIGRPEGL